jgi:hypothetical protein
MKYILLLPFSLSFFYFSTAQTIQIDSLTNVYQSKMVIQMDTLKKDLLYNKTKEWLTIYYKSANDVIQLADKESYKIIVKGNFTTNLFMKEGLIGHTLIIDFKDGKIRCIYSDFSYSSTGSGNIAFESNSLGFKKKIFLETEDNIKASIDNLKNYILQNNNKNDDW